MNLRSLAHSLVAIAMLIPATAIAYPLDGYESTGIRRLQVQRMVQEGKAKGKKRPGVGELLPLDQVKLRLLDHKQMDLPPVDAALTATLRRLIGAGAGRYGMGLLDLSDPSKPRYAELNGNTKQNPGSVGKILVALGLYQALADMYPDDIDARKRVLRDTVITADIFSVSDHHTVPKWDDANGRLYRQKINEGDQATLYTYLDWMMSPSSNSAAAMIQKQLVLMKHFGKAYPPSEEQAAAFLKDTPRTEKSKLFLDAITGPVTRNGLDIDALRQGSFFTRQGKRKIAGTSSYATARELMRFLVRMEQGRLVDEWSSLEIKRMMYITERRIRYASSGILRKSAVYFKSGSLYSCEPEPGFTCKKYHGNKRNYMNSIAIIESPAGQNQLFYMATVLSNVLKKNSAQDHRDLARAVHQKMMADHPQTAEQHARASAAYGEGFVGYAAERADLALAIATQEQLLALGYEIGDIDGQIGSNTRKAISNFQSKNGMAADGKPSQALVDKMKATALKRGLARPDVPGSN